MNRIFIIIWVNSLFFKYAWQSDFTFHILHTNDMHAQYETSSRGGYGRVMQFIAEERAKDPDRTIYLDCGDVFTGTVWFTVHKWLIAAAFWEALLPNVSCVGNHEFDTRVIGLSAYLNLIKTPLVCCNCDVSAESRLKGKIIPYKILTIGSTKIGIVGYLCKESRQSDTSFGGVQITDEIEAVRKEVEKLTAKNITIIIALSHSGIDIDIKVAENVLDVDVVVGGHSHTFLENYPAVVTRRQQGKIVNVPVVQAYAFAQYAGKLTLSFNKKGNLTRFQGKLYEMSKMHPHPDLDNILNRFRKEVDVFKDTKCGISYTPFYGFNEECRKNECNIANLALDAYIHKSSNKYRGNDWSNIGIAICNGGAIRTGIKPEDGKAITLDVLLNVFTFANIIETLNVSGAVLREAMEFSVKDNYYYAGFLQYSGVHVIYDYSKPAGQRIKSVKVRCAYCKVPKYEALDDNKHYLILVNDYLAEGGDGYLMLKNKKLENLTADELDVNMVCQYMQFFKTVEPHREERIILLNQNSTSVARNNITTTNSSEEVKKKYSNSGYTNMCDLILSIILLSITFCNKFV